MSTQAEMTVYFAYLDKMRASGAINMYGASPYLQREFGIISPTHARRICQQWRDTFNDVQTAAERAAQVTE